MNADEQTRTLVPFGAEVQVGALEVLLPFTNLGEQLDKLLFTLVNLDGANTVHLLVETSQDGIHPDGGTTWDVSVGPGKQGTVEVGDKILNNFWRVSAQTEAPDFPDVQVKWQVKWVRNAR